MFEINGQDLIEYLSNSKLLENYFLIVPFRLPLYVYVLVSIFSITIGCFRLYNKGFKEGIRDVFFCVLLGYVVLLICSMCLYREVSEARDYCFEPFWSYKEIFKGNPSLLVENLMNVVVFIPIGLLLPFSLKGYKFKCVLLAGLSLSLTIELLQFVFKTGYCEFDDLFHNTLGATIGYVLSVILVTMFSFIEKVLHSVKKK